MPGCGPISRSAGRPWGPRGDFSLTAREDNSSWAAVHPDGKLVGNPDLADPRFAKPGDHIALDGTGIGPSPVFDLVTPPALTTQPVTATIGNATATVEFATAITALELRSHGGGRRRPFAGQGTDGHRTVGSSRPAAKLPHLLAKY